MSAFCRRKRPLYFIILVFIFSLFALGSNAFAQAFSFQTSFYIGAGGNGFLTDETLLFIANKSPEIVTLSIREKAQNPYFDYSGIVDRLKTLNPAIKILGYGSVTMSNNWDRIDGFFFRHLQTYGPPEEFFLHTPDANGNPIVDPDHRIQWDGTNYYQMDIRNQNYQSARVQALADFFEKYPNLDGIFLDETYFLGGPYMKYYPNDQEFRATYPGHVKEIFKQIKARLPQKLIIFNGLAYDHKPQQEIITPAENYLEVTDGAAIEFFCGTNAADAPVQIDFNLQVKPYLDIMANPIYQDKYFLVYGRGGENDPYSLEYQKETYCLASFLLGKTPKSFFSFFKGIESSLFSSRKFSGMDYYDNQELYLGAPLGSFFVQNGVYQRRFEKGYVLVAPNDLSAPVTIQLDQDYFDQNGNIANSVTLKSGQAKILTVAKACNNNSLCNQGETVNSCKADCRVIKKENFEAEATTTLPFQWYPDEQAVKRVFTSELQSHSVQVTTAAAPFSSENWHALKLDRVSRQISPQYLAFKIKSEDPNLIIRIYLQADDGTNGELHYPTLALLPKPTDFVNVADLEIAPYEKTKIIQLGLGQDLISGQWQRHRLDLTKLIKKSSLFDNYNIHKVDGLYIHGSFEMDDVILSYQPICSGAADLNCDGQTNLLDLLAWRRLWVQGDAGADVNGDGGHNILDYLQVLQEWLQ